MKTDGRRRRDRPADREKAKTPQLQANAAVAASADTAILLARQNEHLERTAKANEFSRLALKELGIDPDTLDIFSDLGIRKISDLRRVPVDDLINRYGQKFRDVIDIIEQKGGRILTPNVKESSLTWAYDLDFPVEDFEQLIFVVNRARQAFCTDLLAAWHRQSIKTGAAEKSSEGLRDKNLLSTSKIVLGKAGKLRIALDRRVRDSSVRIGSLSPAKA